MLAELIGARRSSVNRVLKVLEARGLVRIRYRQVQLGAPLARLEARLFLSTLLHRTAAIERAGEPQWRDLLTLRGLASLPVTLVPA